MYLFISKVMYMDFSNSSGLSPDDQTKQNYAYFMSSPHFGGHPILFSLSNRS